MNPALCVVRVLAVVAAAVGLALAAPGAGLANHEEFGVCHRTGAATNPFVFISPDQSSSHLDDQENPQQGHEGDREATAEEFAAGECFGATEDDTDGDTTDTTDAVDDTTDAVDVADDAADAVDDGAADATDGGGTTLPATGHGGAADGGTQPRALVVGLLALLLAAAGWWHRQATGIGRH